MKQRRRIYYLSAQRSEIWDRWQAGESMSSIGRRFDRESSSVFSVISPTGGIRPSVRRRPKQALSLFEREGISRGLSTQCSLRSIARQLGRSASTTAVKSIAIVAWIAIGLPGPIKPPTRLGLDHCDCSQSEQCVAHDFKRGVVRLVAMRDECECTRQSGP